ncbi:hypothetical protein FRB90_003235 [Tulasnella sp. 427]|nr:hypothetical protein FRB90_003235 [Tulasnella sp. 427]
MSRKIAVEEPQPKSSSTNNSSKTTVAIDHQTRPITLQTMPAAVVPSPLAASLSSALHRTPSQSRPKSDGKTSVDLSNANAHANVSSRASVARTTAVAAGPTIPRSQLTADIPSIPSSSPSFSTTPTSSSGLACGLSRTTNEKRVPRDLPPKDAKQLRAGSLAAGPSRTGSQGQLVANLYGGFAMGSNHDLKGGQQTKPFLWTTPKSLPDIFEVQGAAPKHTFTLKEKPEVPEGDDMVYTERGSHEPPKWDSAEAQPKKSCFAKYRYHPYRNPTIPRTDAEVNASLNEAFKKRLAQNYEGPRAITIHDATTDIPVPGTTSWKWVPKNKGPPGAFDFLEGSNLSMSSPASSTGFLADDEADAEEKEEVVKMLFPPNGKKRKFEEDLIEELEGLASSSRKLEPETPAKKKIKTSKSLIANNDAQAKSSFFGLTITPSLVQPSSPSDTTAAASSSECSATEDTPMSDNPSEWSTSTRKARFDRMKAKLRFAEPTGMHPIRKVKDSLDLRQGRIKGRSRGIVSDKKKCTLKRSPSTWTAWEAQDAKILKGRWESVRKAKFARHTCPKTIGDNVVQQEELDPLWVQWGTVVERFEAAYPLVDLAGVRAKHIRPAKCEEPGTGNKEATRMLEPSEVMRGWYPAWEHPAWDGIPEGVLYAWRQSAHYQVVVGEVKNALSAEEGERKRRWAAAATERMDAETVVDGEEDAMRRAFVAEDNGTEGVPPPPAPLETSPLQVIPTLKMDPEVEAVWEARWSAPSALPPTLPVA